MTSWIVCVTIRTGKDGWMNEERRMRRTRLRASSCVETIMERLDRKQARLRRTVGWTLDEEYEDIQDDETFTDGVWNKNPVVFEQKYSLDIVLALDANDGASDNEVVKEAETATVEGEAVDFLEVYDDRKDEATLCDIVTEEGVGSREGSTSDRVAC